MNTHLTPSHGFALGSLVRPTFGDTSLIGEIVTVYADSTVSVYFDRPDAEARIHTAGLVLA